MTCYHVMTRLKAEDLERSFQGTAPASGQPSTDDPQAIFGGVCGNNRFFTVLQDETEWFAKSVTRHSTSTNVQWKSCWSTKTDPPSAGPGGSVRGHGVEPKPIV